MTGETGERARGGGHREDQRGGIRVLDLVPEAFLHSLVNVKLSFRYRDLSVHYRAQNLLVLAESEKSFFSSSSFRYLFPMLL